MLEQIKLGLQSWKSKTSDRQKLQTTYLVSSALLLILAGLIGLLDSTAGHDIAYIAGLGLIVFVINAAMWHLIIENVLSHIKPNRSRK